MDLYSRNLSDFYRGDLLVARLLDSDYPCAQEIHQEGDGIFRIKRLFRPGNGLSPPTPAAPFKIEIETGFSPVYYAIPGVSYQGNDWGSGLEPKGLCCNGQPWVYSACRSTLPGATYSEDKRDSVCLFGKAEKLSFSMSLREQKGKIIHVISFPRVEQPFTYSAKNRYMPAYAEPVHIWGEVLLEAYLVLAPAQKCGESLRAALDYGWRSFSHSTSPRYLPEQLWEYGIHFIKNSLYFSTDSFAGFCMGLYFDAGKWEQRRGNLEAGWVGQNISQAATLLYDFKKNNCRDSLDMGLRVLDCWKKALLPNGLFRCRYDRLLKYGEDINNTHEVQDAANLFGVVKGYLRAWRVLETLGIARPDYRALALAICDFALEAQTPQGAFAKSWYNNGSVANPDGTIGAYMAWALLEGFSENGDKRYLKAAMDGFAYYDNEFIKLGYTTAGALDTYCVDKESAMPLLAISVTLYELTGESRFLERAESISWYLAGWQYHYSISYPENTLLGQYGYDTLGATAVSVQHHHVDAYALQFYKYWIKLAKYTGNRQWHERAVSIWNNATQFISDGGLVIDGSLRPTGSQDEGVCQTRWHTSRGEFYHTSRWLVGWNNAFRLEILSDAAYDLNRHSSDQN